MKRTRFATVFLVMSAALAAQAFARDDGPRFVQDELDALVVHHAEANWHIAGAWHASQPAMTQTPQTRSDAS